MTDVKERKKGERSGRGAPREVSALYRGPEITSLTRVPTGSLTIREDPPRLVRDNLRKMEGGGGGSENQKRGKGWSQNGGTPLIQKFLLGAVFS